MIAEYLAIVMRPKMTERKLVAIAVATIAVAAVAAIVELVALKLLGDYHQILSLFLEAVRVEEVVSSQDLEVALQVQAVDY